MDALRIANAWSMKQTNNIYNQMSIGDIISALPETRLPADVPGLNIAADWNHAGNGRLDG